MNKLQNDNRVTYPVAIQRRFTKRTVSLISETDILLKLTPGNFTKSKGAVLRIITFNTLEKMAKPYRVFAVISNKGTKVEFIPVTI
jgi:hypothetical protein